MKKFIFILATLVIGLSFTTLEKEVPPKEGSIYLLLKSNGEYVYKDKVKPSDKAAIFVKIAKKPEIEKMKGKVKTKKLTLALKALEDEPYKIMMDVPCQCRDKNNNLVWSKWCGPGCAPSQAAIDFQKRFPHLHPNVACCVFLVNIMEPEFKKVFQTI